MYKEDFLSMVSFMIPTYQLSDLHKTSIHLLKTNLFTFLLSFMVFYGLLC